MKESDKVLLPNGNFVLISLRENESEGCIPFTPLDDLPLDLRHGPAIKV